MRYQTLDRILKKKADYNLIMSGRSTGKSTDMCKHLIKWFKEDGAMFLRLFRKTTHRKDNGESWFDEFNEGGKFYEGDQITFDGENYYLNGELFGETAIINLARNYKSRVFNPRIKRACFDEYIGISFDDYVDDEVNKFKSILTTCFRNRDRQVFLLGNNENEMSKYNPYHRLFGIDIDKDRIKQGDIRIYKSGKWKNPAIIAFEYGRIAAESESELPRAERFENNDVVTTGDFAKVWDVFDYDDRYDHKLSFLRDSIDNYFICDDYGRCYFPVVNDDKQCIDWIKADDDLREIGKNGNYNNYNQLIEYQEYFTEMYGEDDYMSALTDAIPYEVATPLYSDENRYGENCSDFRYGVSRNYGGYTYMYCDGNIKRIVEQVIMRGVLPK